MSGWREPGGKREEKTEERSGMNLSKLVVAATFVTFGRALAWGGEPLQVGPGKKFEKPSAAVKAAKDGDVIEIDAAGTYDGDVCFVKAHNLTLRGVGEGRAKIPAAGQSAGGKAIWVIQGDNATVENIEFSGCRVPDGNGAGIRLEGTSLAVRNCRFHDCQDTILTGKNPKSEVLIEFSEFSYSGLNTDPVTHNLYVGEIRKLVYRFNYSHHVKEGNSLKCRALETHVLYSRLSDEADGSASFIIDLPHGGKAYIVGNVLQKGPKAHNHPFIAYGREGVKHAESELYVVNNTFVNDRDKGVFLEINKVKDDFKLTARNNIFSGTGTVCNWPKAAMEGNFIGDPLFVDAAKRDYRLKPGSPCIDRGVEPGKAGEVSLKPEFQYVHPAKSEKRPEKGAIDVGAYEFP